MVSAIRLFTPTLRSRRPMCAFTVLSSISSAMPISRLDRPARSSSSTCSSRGVNLGGALGGTGEAGLPVQQPREHSARRPHRAVAHHLDGHRKLGLLGRQGQVSLGPRADDPLDVFRTRLRAQHDQLQLGADVVEGGDQLEQVAGAFSVDQYQRQVDIVQRPRRRQVHDLKLSAEWTASPAHAACRWPPRLSGPRALLQLPP